MPTNDFGRGLEAGRVSTTLAEHEEHLALINGAVADTAKALVDLASEVRGLREDARLREDRVGTKAATLAVETERRRSELADTVDTDDRRFTRRERSLGLGLAGVVVVVNLVIALNPFD